MAIQKKFQYWKVQYFEERSHCWKDIQKAWHDMEEAEAAAIRSEKKRVRLMQIEDRGKRMPLPEIKK